MTLKSKPAAGTGIEGENGGGCGGAAWDPVSPLAPGTGSIRLNAIGPHRAEIAHVLAVAN
jgi:hypothetical protein